MKRRLIMLAVVGVIAAIGIASVLWILMSRIAGYS